MNLKAAMALFTVCPNKEKLISVPAGTSLFSHFILVKEGKFSLTQGDFFFLFMGVCVCVCLCVQYESTYLWLYMWASRCVRTCAYMHPEAKGQSLVSSSITFEPYQDEFFH